ncbi:ECF transporter S component [Candidatus Bathyarchaeota archaeon]|nr:ECF transporter S component [Candidatus Bathyarchaeota archaeon]
MSYSENLLNSRELSLIIILSSLGGVMSVPIGYAGNMLKAIPGLPFGSSQALSGLHVLWLVLASVLVRKKGVGTITGITKGLVEMFLFSYHGVFVLIMSAVEGLMVDVVLTLLRRVNTRSLCLAGGLSSASNVAVTQFMIAPRLPLFVFAFMYIASFVSGLFFAGYLGKRVLDIISSSTRLSPEARARNL